MKPDFSGEWLLNVAASSLSPHVAATVRSGFVHITHHEPNVTVHLSVTFDGPPVEFRFDRVADGVERRAQHDGALLVWRLAWDGDALVFSDVTPTPAGEMTIVFRYELEDGGRRLRASEQLRSSFRNQDNVWVFDRGDGH